jgi:hypothetical protein
MLVMTLLDPQRLEVELATLPTELFWFTSKVANVQISFVPSKWILNLWVPGRNLDGGTPL